MTCFGVKVDSVSWPFVSCATFYTHCIQRVPIQLSPIKDNDRLLQDVDINRLRAVVFRDVVSVTRWKSIFHHPFKSNVRHGLVTLLGRTTASKLSSWLWPWSTSFRFSWCPSTATSWSLSARRAGQAPSRATLRNGSIRTPTRPLPQVSPQLSERFTLVHSPAAHVVGKRVGFFCCICLSLHKKRRCRLQITHKQEEQIKWWKKNMYGGI